MSKKGSELVIKTKDIENLMISITGEVRKLVTFLKISDINRGQYEEVNLRASVLSMFFHLIFAIVLGYIFFNPFKINIFFKSFETIIYLLGGEILCFKEFMSFFEWLPIVFKNLYRALKTKGVKGLFVTNKYYNGKIKLI